jgi:hypothetical protein
VPQVGQMRRWSERSHSEALARTSSYGGNFWGGGAATGTANIVFDVIVRSGVHCARGLA